LPDGAKDLTRPQARRARRHSEAPEQNQQNCASSAPSRSASWRKKGGCATRSALNDRAGATRRPRRRNAPTAQAQRADRAGATRRPRRRNAPTAQARSADQRQ